MIRELRRWHRRWIVLLAVALPLLLFLALRGRPSVPLVDTLPAPSGPAQTDPETAP
ncbi:MAG: hypothetical protein O7A98_08045 [Acidobacteria bacterium]|nr:hypothetical protein [Acidobacteriota bacterium]